jgi:hypothetical protein
MLQGRKRQAKDAMLAQPPTVVATASPDPGVAASTFGAGVLHGRTSRARWVVAVVLAVAAITAGYLLTRGGASSSKPDAAAVQNK